MDGFQFDLNHFSDSNQAQDSPQIFGAFGLDGQSIAPPIHNGSFFGTNNGGLIGSDAGDANDENDPKRRRIARVIPSPVFTAPLREAYSNGRRVICVERRK